MKPRFILFVPLFLIGFASEICSQLTLDQTAIQADGVTFSMETFVDKALQHFDDENNQVSGYQVVFSRNGQLYHQESRGWAIHPNDHAGAGIAMQNTTRFDVASVSKWLCTIVLANVMHDNGIAFDDPVEPYLPPSWPAQMADEYFDANSPCYLTFGKLIKHETCLGWPGDKSGPIGGTKEEVLLALSDGELNLAEFGEYQNGNFVLTRIVIGEILAGGWMNENSSSYDLLNRTAYLSALQSLIYDPLDIEAPSSHAELDDFFDGNVPYRYAFPFNPNETCDGVLGVDHQPGNYNFLGSTGAVISSIELAAIMAYFVHDDSGTIIPHDIRDEILSEGYGLSGNEWSGGNTTYGRYYRKGGLLSNTCGSNDNVKRGYRTSVVAYPNGVEMVVTSNSRVDFLGDMAREWENAWVQQECAFVHTTTDNSVTGHFSMIDHPALNFDEDRLVFASPIYRPGVGNISPTGVWYDGEKWGVFNETLLPMPVGSQWAIFSVPDSYPLAFKHEAVDGNTLANITIIDHPLLNDNPDAELIVSQNWGSVPGVFNPHNIAVYYSGTRWTILNLDYADIPEGAGFNVYIHPTAVQQEVVDQPLGNTGELDIAFNQDSGPGDPILVTNVYGAGLPFNDAPVGTWFYEGEWNLYNTDFDAMPLGTTVNYAHLSDLRASSTASSYLVYVIDDQTYQTNGSLSDTHECLDSAPFPEISTSSFCYSADMILSDGFSTFYEPSRVRVSYSDPLSGDPLSNFSFYRYLEDDEPPVIMNVPSDMVTSCDAGDPTMVTAADNCHVELSYEDEVTGEDCDFIIERTWTAVDRAGNSSTATQLIYSGSEADKDNDGFDIFMDCDDSDPYVNPAAVEYCDGVDNDCDMELDEDCLDCQAFLDAPTDLTKSYSPVNGVQDRVQLKWYKATPQIKYTDEDAAMCDIRFWAKRDLDPVTGNPVGPVIADPDTIVISDAKKTYGSGAPREIFKWPIKFRADGVNNNKRVDPNTRYEWQVRCECGHDGGGPESPWSEVKTFNTPDFDPSTGIFLNSGMTLRSSEDPTTMSMIFPNPSDGEYLFISGNMTEFEDIRIYDAAGRMVTVQQFREDAQTRIQFDEQLAAGLYTLHLIGGVESQLIRFMVR